jgi:hypothetical protein
MHVYKYLHENLQIVQLACTNKNVQESIYETITSKN